MRRKDQAIRTALADKQRLVADILHVPHADLDCVAFTEQGSAAAASIENDGEKEASHLVMAAIAQGIFASEIQLSLPVDRIDSNEMKLVLDSVPAASRLTTVLNETLRLTEEEAIAGVSEPSPPLPATCTPHVSATAGVPTTSPRSSRRASRMPGAPTPKLLAISDALNRDLTQLLVFLFNMNCWHQTAPLNDLSFM